MLALMLAAATATTAQAVPTQYEAGHFYATPQTTGGQSLHLLVDTGGGGAAGMYWITAGTASHLHLKAGPCAEDASIRVAPAPTFEPGAGLPVPQGACGGSVMINEVPHEKTGEDGQLGASYLGTRAWTFDYPAHRLVAEGGHWAPAVGTHRTPLGFRHEAGEPALYFPRIVVQVDGQPIDFLLDTGATAHPTAEGKRIVGTETVHGFGVTSYITTSMLDRWHAAHPDWRVVTQGDDLFGPSHVMRLIEVPKLVIAGWTVGPVWFTERPDKNFHQFMAQMMDKPPEGAIGGNVFDHFRMTLDYPHATAWFDCARGCTRAVEP
ncbi:hypothetical protein [Dyella sp.]|uniref:hypothetical protein n=1 Tax=Dyella sp. TaxID=1869338 RepID=UPI003F7D2FAA